MSDETPHPARECGERCAYEDDDLGPCGGRLRRVVVADPRATAGGPPSGAGRGARGAARARHGSDRAVADHGARDGGPAPGGVMLPEFARKWEKWVREYRVENGVTARVYGTVPEEPDGSHIDYVGNSAKGLTEKEAAFRGGWMAAMGHWWSSPSRPAFVLDLSLWDELSVSDPAPAPVFPPVDAGVAYLQADDEHGGAIAWAPIVAARLVPAPVGTHLICLNLSESERGCWLMDFRRQRPAVGSHNTALWNLFALMADRAITQAPVNGGHTRAITHGERVKAAHRPYTRLYLAAPIRPRAAEAGEPTGRTLAAHLRRGHWKRFWVRDPGEKQSLSTKPGKHGPLHEVRTWVRPCHVGAGEPRRRQYVVGL